eukprot:scaffold27237_cov234-Skeletonema_marinoi.AAC.1
MANYYGSLEPVDCHIHSVRYDMAVNSELAAVIDGFIRSPTMLYQRQYDQKRLNRDKDASILSWPTIMGH